MASLWHLPVSLVPYAMARYGDRYQQRSLESILADNSNFITDSSAKKEVAKYHDALDTPLLNIQLDSVSPPYIHILLGIVLKYHKLLEDTAHMLDTQITNQKSEFLTPLGESVKTYGSHWQQLQELKNKHQIEEGCLVFSEEQSDIHRHSQTIENIEQRLSSLSHADLTPRSGPIASALDTILNKHRITPQAYHSRPSVGNHCHKYLQENVYTELTDNCQTNTSTHKKPSSHRRSLHNSNHI